MGLIGDGRRRLGCRLIWLCGLLRRWLLARPGAGLGLCRGSRLRYRLIRLDRLRCRRGGLVRLDRLRRRRSLRRLWVRLRRWSGRRLGREMDIGLGGLGRDVHPILSELALTLRCHLVARSLVWHHLRERLRLLRILLLVLGRCHGWSGLIGLLIRLLVLGR